MTSPESQADLRERIDTIEAAYERFLGYAARGTDGSTENKVDSGIRQALTDTITAIEGLTESATSAAGGRAECDAWIEVIGADAGKSLAALKMIKAQELISSQMIDNLNASIHLRALLTDLFVIDEVLKSARRAQS